MKNYYAILELTSECTENDIRKSYRRLAMKYHPDRNPDDLEAEEKFKEIAEAYGVLTDEKKRQEYDAFMGMGTAGKNRGGQEFSYKQDEILRDLFNDPRFQAMFRTILGEFKKAGFRAGPSFIRRSFFGNKGAFIVGGVFWVGSVAGTSLIEGIKKKIPEPAKSVQSVSRSVGKQIGRWLSGGENKKKIAAASGADIIYKVSLSSSELEVGKELTLQVKNDGGVKKIRVQLPPGSRSGQKLRLKGYGRQGTGGCGDLYIELVNKK